MQKQDLEDETARSRPSSRRNSATSRRNSAQKEREVKKKSPLNSTPSSTNSTPKKQAKQNLELCVTGKQILRKGDRANSLPGYQRRASGDGLRAQRRPTEAALSPRKTIQQPANSRDTSLEDDMSLDLSQVSDCEDTSSKYGAGRKFTAAGPAATSTPKGAGRAIHKSRSASLQTQLHSQKVDTRRSAKEGRQSISTFCSRDDLLYKSPSSNSNYRYTTELDYSSVSPEYSGQSSTDLSPRATRETDPGLSPRSQELHVSSCCVSTWQDCSDSERTKVEEYRRGDAGEWNNFWANYNNSICKVPMKSYYDQCPTPYRTEDINLADLEFSTTSSMKRSPDDVRNINNIIRNEGLHLTPRETQNIIKCAHILGSVLTKAIERRSKEKDIEQDEGIEENVIVEEVDKDTKEKENLGSIDAVSLAENEKETKKKSLSLNLRETAIPMEVKEEKRQETVTTQTDISLPNTKSAPKIFEKILRQLSKSSLEESLDKKTFESKELEKKALENRELKKKELEIKDMQREDDVCDSDNKELENTDDDVEK